MFHGLFLAMAMTLLAAPTPLPTPVINEHTDYWAHTLQTHPMKLVRKNSARMLGQLGDLTAVPSLTAALRDPFQGVRVEAAKALGLLGPEESLSALFEVGQRDSDAQVRQAAKKAIEFIKARQENRQKKDLKEKAKAAP